MARALGCEARRVEEHGELLSALDEVLPGLAAGARTPLLLEVVVEPDSGLRSVGRERRGAPTRLRVSGRLI